ncbi:MAG: nucleotidyltransferase domain-containing protein [Armatimonadetes bacterium]|nr:nucleotidyltransferase domain-containing protein [Armatimonadota bacterium]
MSNTQVSPAEQGLQVARSLADWLRERFGGRIQATIVFGSVARGEADDESDVDMLILVRDKLSRAEEKEISEYSYDLDLANGTVTQWFVETVEHWDAPAVRSSGLRKAVEREGIPV